MPPKTTVQTIAPIAPIISCGIKKRVMKIKAKKAIVSGLVTLYQGILNPFGKKSLDSRYFLWASIANA